MLGITTTNARVGGFRGGILADSKTIYNRIIADGGVSDLTRLNFFVKGLKAIYGSLTNVPVCYDAHWIGYKLGSGTGATAGQAAAKLYSIKNTENLLTFSEEFDNAAWTKNSSTITANATIAPNGTMTADKLIDTASSAQHWAFQSTTNTLTSATISCYMKKGERTWGIIRTRTTINDFFAWFNLDNGTLGTVESGITASITDAGNGWYRCIVVNPNPTTSANPSIIGLSNANNVTTYTGDGTSGIFVWGAQFNTGSVALPYTQTTTTTQTLADAVQSTAASQPLLLAHNGDNYFYVPRVDGNNSTTPDTVTNRISGDIEIISYIEVKGTEADRTIVGKGDGSNANYVLAVSTSNIPYFINGDLVSKNATAALPNVNTWLRATRVSSTGDIKFWTSTDSKTTAPLSVNWTQLGTTVSGPTGTRTTTTGIITIGKYSAYTGNSFNGSIYRATISNSIGGTPVVDFNPATYNASTSQTAWTSSTGEVWTISTGTATSGYKGVLVDRTIVQGDGVDDWISNSTVLRGDICTQYLSLKYYHTPNAGVDMVGAYDLASYNSIALLSATGIRCYQENGANALNASVIYGTLNLISLINRGGANSLQINNGTAVTNSQNPSTSKTGLVLFRNAFNGGIQAGFINTYIDSSAEDNLTTKTATYNLIRSLNNNAF